MAQLQSNDFGDYRVGLSVLFMLQLERSGLQVVGRIMTIQLSASMEGSSFKPATSTERGLIVCCRCQLKCEDQRVYENLYTIQ